MTLDRNVIVSLILCSLSHPVTLNIVRRGDISGMVTDTAPTSVKCILLPFLNIIPEADCAFWLLALVKFGWSSPRLQLRLQYDWDLRGLPQQIEINRGDHKTFIMRFSTFFSRISTFQLPTDSYRWGLGLMCSDFVVQ